MSDKTTTICAALLLPLLAASCGDAIKPKSTGKGGPAPLPGKPGVVKPGPGAVSGAPKGLKRGNVRLVKAVEQVMLRCQIDRWRGTVTKCKPLSAAANLQRIEAEIGVDQSLLTYCYAMEEKFHKLLRPLARNRIAFVGTAKATRKASESTFRCLLKTLEPGLEVIELNTLARVATYISTRLGKQQELFDKLGAWRNRTPLVVAHNALWANGRLKVIGTLAKLLKGTAPADVPLRLAAIKGLSRFPAHTDEERGKLCPLLVPLMTDKDLDTASAAIFRVSRTCPDLRPKALEAAEALAKRKLFDPNLVAALAAWGLPETLKWSPAEQKRAQAVLTRVASQAGLRPAVRGSALRGLQSLDPAAAKRLARRYQGKATPEPLRQAALAILNKAAPKKAAPASQPAAPKANKAG